MSRPWMPLYIADYLGDTQHLSTIEHGAYLLLIMHYWQQECLPTDETRLARIARMTLKEWSNAKATLAALFDPDWKHGRIDAEIAHTDEKYDARAKAGHKGGKASALSRKQAKLGNGFKQKPSNASSNATAKTNQPHPQPTDSEASASGADAPVDHRKRLFNEGLAKLSAMTGKGPDACRAFVGKCLKAASDDAVTVLGLIEDAERNQVIDPSAWIAARLKPMEIANGKPKSAIIQAADDLCRKLASFDGPPRGADELRSDAGENPPRLLSHG
jgi:uncharacterized protein YdaU (DUF1376 family)